MSDSETRSSDAARHLADVLLREANSLDSEELPVVGASMAAIRASGRQLTETLRVRGWGTGPPGEGLGLTEDDEDDEDDEDLGPDDDDDGPTPNGPRMTYQARSDYIVVDEDALVSYVTERLRQKDPDLDPEREPLTYGQAFFVLFSELENPYLRDYTDAGLHDAGAKDSTFQISRTLWEMDDEEAEDEYPIG
jgi:hypothetical protein